MIKLRTKIIRIAAVRKDPFLMKKKKSITSELALIKAIIKIIKTIIDSTKKLIGLV
jgi:hypothetical protein